LITQGINNLGGQVRIGAEGKFITFSIGDALKIKEYLPATGSSYVFKHKDAIAISSASFEKTYTNRSGFISNRINNPLLAQAITLALNIGLNGALSDLEIRSGAYLVTANTVGCGSNVMQPCGFVNPYHSYSFDAPLVNALPQKTVAGLYELASRALAGEKLPSGVTLSMIAKALNVVNNAFDGCRIFVGYTQKPMGCNQTVFRGGGLPNPDNNDAVTVSATPNPYNDAIHFVIQSAISGNAVLDVYNTAGAKLRTVYQGHISSNMPKTIDFNVPDNQRVHLIYVLRIGEHQVTGKLVNIK
jgi:hypothetical protein